MPKVLDPVKDFSPSLLDVHGKLSELCYAVQLTLSPLNVGVSAVWRNGTYLTVQIECRFRDVQLIRDRLMHGALADKYDYRFRSVSYQTGLQPLDYVTVTSVPDMQFDDNKRRYKL